MVRNKFNLLSAKEWLPFQKSWFRFTDYEGWLVENIRFFTKSDEWNRYQYIHIPNAEKLLPGLSRITGLDIRNTLNKDDKLLQFALIDVMERCNDVDSVAQAEQLTEEISAMAAEIFQLLEHKRFLAIAAPNLFINGHYYPLAWQLALSIGRFFSLKDEKIACWTNDTRAQQGPAFFYVLYFRKDERSGVHQTQYFPHAFRQVFSDAAAFPDENFPAWFILKPPPRKKDEILHPAKFPENLADMFIEIFTSPGDAVFDPMAGTGSTLCSALIKGRKAYGIELSNFFKNIAEKRIEATNQNPMNYRIMEGDALKASEMNFPKMDYMLSSPPYWDMLNMKGAEYQARRKEKGLQLNYSDHPRDLGNMNDYPTFIQSLVDIYFHIDEHLLKPGAHITLIIKNIKKSGSNYPLAWDLARILSQRWQLLPECFWCQDDISIAPYGYGNTWVSNTFHQYCLNFRKPAISWR